MKLTPEQEKGLALRLGRRLPENLRTEHWFNDWQHAVFVITFDHLARSIQGRQRLMTERLLDKLTVYLFVHFLCEEEGMSWAAARGLLDGDDLARHQHQHVRYLERWHRDAQRPFRAGEINGDELAARIEEFYTAILSHIEHTDQVCYGVRSARDGASRLAEVAHVAATGLPLSPNMGGAVEVVARLSRETRALLRPDILPLRAAEPLKALGLLAEWQGQGGTGMRHRFLGGLNQMREDFRQAA